MKMRYDQEDDVLMIWLSDQRVEYAEQEKNMIVHFSKADQPVLVEILNASAFLKTSPNPLRHVPFSSPM